MKLSARKFSVALTTVLLYYDIHSSRVMLCADAIGSRYGYIVSCIS